MGNCFNKDSSLQFGGEDWGSATSEKFLRNEENTYDEEEEEEGLMSKKTSSFSPLASNGSEVKIKVSKKELEELVNRANLEGLTIQEVILQLMNVGDRLETQHQRSWRPALQSIPETEVNC